MRPRLLPGERSSALELAGNEHRRTRPLLAKSTILRIATGGPVDFSIPNPMPDARFAKCRVD